MFRHKHLLKFEDHLLLVKINSNPKFLAVNKMVGFKIKPTLIYSWKICPLEYHLLTPAKTFRFHESHGVLHE